MEDNCREDDRAELDRIVDCALASYSGLEPLAGIEERVLNRVQLAGVIRSRSNSLRWGLSLAGVAVMMLAGVLQIARIRPVSSGPQRPRELAVGQAGSPAQLVAPPGRPLTSIAKLNKPRKPKFTRRLPAAASLTAEERALRAFTERYPVEAQRALAELLKRNDQPIEIEAIQIPPLQSDGIN